MSGGRDWTTGDVRRLNELRSRRACLKDIAAELGRTENAISSYLRYVPASPGNPASLKATHSFPKPPKPPKPRSERYWTLEECRTLIALVEDGASCKQAARVLDRSVVGTRDKAGRLGLHFRGWACAKAFRVEQETDGYRRNAIEGSAKLLDAMLALVDA